MEKIEVLDQERRKISTVDRKHRENETRWAKVRKVVLLLWMKSGERPGSHGKKGRNKMHYICALNQGGNTAV